MTKLASQKKKEQRKKEKRRKQIREAQKRYREKVKSNQNLQVQQKIKHNQYVQTYRKKKSMNKHENQVSMIFLYFMCAPIMLEKATRRIQKRKYEYKKIGDRQKVIRILNRVMKKIHLTKFIESGDRKPIKLYPQIFSKHYKGYYLTKEELSYLEEYILSKGDNFKNYRLSTCYAPWAGDKKYEYMTGSEIQKYLDQFKKDCKI